jgi:hypothetical protein
VVRGSFNGVVIKAKKASYALGVIGRERVRFGTELGTDGATWARIAEKLPGELEIDLESVRLAEPQKGVFGVSLGVDFELKAGEDKIIRFILTWHSPNWEGGGYPWSDEVDYPKLPPDGVLTSLQLIPSRNTYTHMYAKTYISEVHAAFKLADDYESLLKRILSWQQVIYSETKLPPWLREVLVNNLHLITEVGMWAQSRPPIGDWCRPEDGLWGMNECPRGCPQIECGDNSYYGGMAVQYFFPQLTRSTLRRESLSIP